MSKTSNPIPENQLNHYNKLVEEFPQLERKGKTTPYTSINGHMTSFLAKDGMMGLRLSKEDRDLFLAQFSCELIEQHGRVMKEFVAVPDALLLDTASLVQWFEKSFRYVSGLKGK